VLKMLRIRWECLVGGEVRGGSTLVEEGEDGLVVGRGKEGVVRDGGQAC
jgi:hypothetical protein